MSKEHRIVLRFKTIAFLSEVGFTKTGIPEFRRLGDVAMEIARDLSQIPPGAEEGLAYRLIIRDELISVRKHLEVLAMSIQPQSRLPG